MRTDRDPRRHASPDECDDVWRELVRRQLPAIETDMSVPFVQGFRRAGLDPSVMPRHRELSRRLHDRCGWRIETVPGLIPVADFFALLRERRFPSPEWIRHPDDLTYTPEPDLFHDVFGHVPQLCSSAIRAVIEPLAEAARDASATDLLRLERIYWFTVEFGLMRDEDGEPRGWGAGLASSIAELQRAVRAPDVERVPLVTARAASTDFATDRPQPVYMVAASLAGLADRLQRAGCSPTVP